MPNFLKAAGNRLRGRVSLAMLLVPGWLKNLRWHLDYTFLSLSQKGYGRNSVVYAILRLLATAVPEAPLRAYQVSATGERTPLPKGHALARLLRRPNELMTDYEMLELLVLHLCIAGRSYWWIDRDNVGTPRALWPLRPDRVGPAYSLSSRDGERVLWGWHYQEPGTATLIPVPRSEILAFNFPDPSGQSGGIIEGLGPLQVLAREIGADNEATDYVGSLLANGAQPGLALKVKTPISDEETARLLKARFKHEFGGPNKGEPAIIDADSEIQPITFTMRELEFPALRDNAESRLAAGFGVPPMLVGLNVGLKAGTRATLKELREYFTETTLEGWWRRLGDKFTADLAEPEYGDDIEIAFDTTHVRALAGQRFEHARPYKDAWLAGAASRDEYREALGLPKLGPGAGDVYLPPSSGVLLLGDGDPQNPALLPPPPVPPGEDGDEDDEEGPPADKKDDPDEDTPAREGRR